jgi:LDH2 family malate/lactate/ureidoglycolate dehydrogenase
MVAPRELMTVIERVFLRWGYAPGTALTAAEYLTAGEIASGGLLLELAANRSVLAELREAPLPEVRSGPEARLLGHNGLSLLVAPHAVDLLEAAWSSGGAAECRIEDTRLPAMLHSVPPSARERGLVVVVDTDEGAAVCRVTGGCEPEPPLAAVTRAITVPEVAWAQLVDDANLILAPATAESRRDAGY